MYAMICNHTSLYFCIVFPVWLALSGFSLVELPNSRRLMYIMAGIPTTLELDTCCARHITISAAQHTADNARSLYVGFCAISSNQSRFKPFKWRAHPA